MAGKSGQKVWLASMAGKCGWQDWPASVAGISGLQVWLAHVEITMSVCACNNYSHEIKPYGSSNILLFTNIDGKL